MQIEEKQLKQLADYDIHIWLKLYGIKNEDGKELDFKDHLFLVQPYEDTSQKLVVKKAAQIGFSTMAILKTLWMAKNMKLNIIYTLPTFNDIKDLVGGKVNRIISQNKILQEYTADKDTIEQKQVGGNLIYYRGTFTEQAALMVSADMIVIDEFDRSKPGVVDQYASRLQHSDYQGEWYFSNPSSQGSGVDKLWGRSDQKHWFIRCQGCQEEQYMQWPESVDKERKVFQCKYCKKELTKEERRVGRWVAKYKDREYSGYWINLMMAPWVSAEKILDYFNTKSEEYFYNFVLGEPYVGGGNKLTRQLFFQNLTEDNLYPESHERVVMGLDTGTQLYYVLGTEKGLFHYGIAKDYTEIEELMQRWPRMVVICDQMGDLIGSRALREKYPGRVWLCLFGEDRKTKELVRWGKNDENGSVVADRNRMIRMVVGEFIDKRVQVMGTEKDWDEYIIHWGNLTQITIKDETTGSIKSKKWVKNGQSDFPFATVYWRIGMGRFSSIESKIIGEKQTVFKEEPVIYANQTMDASLVMNRFKKKKSNDWRKL